MSFRTCSFLMVPAFDFFIEAAPQFSRFEFDRISHGRRDHEVWFLGCHLVVSVG